VLRHFESGSAMRAANAASIPILNAGDGPGELDGQGGVWQRVVLLASVAVLGREVLGYGVYMGGPHSSSSPGTCLPPTF
jgi:hypothetical protein